MTLVNDEFGREYELETPWNCVFNDASVCGPSAAGGEHVTSPRTEGGIKTLMDAVLGSDDEDSDFRYRVLSQRTSVSVCLHIILPLVRS